MEQELAGIVLAQSDYRENDALLSVLTQQGKLRFVARGVQKITSKNAGALFVGSESLFTLQMREGSELHTLKQARLLKSRRRIMQSLRKQALASLYCELMQKCEEMTQGYAWLQIALEDLETHAQGDFTGACVFLNQLCLAQGISPWVDSCVLCQASSPIQTLSLRHGGFLCTRCMDPLHDTSWSRRRLQRFRYLCHARIDQIEQLRAYDCYDFQDFSTLFAFFREYSGIAVKGYAFLAQVEEMETGVENKA